MEESGRRKRSGLEADFACVQIAVIGQEYAPLFTIDGNRALRARMREMIQRGVNTRYH